jgi:hypothetical protein
MHCPYCHAPVTANAPECGECRLTFPRTRTLLGVVPRMEPWIADNTHSLRESDLVRIRRRLVDLTRRYPQLAPRVVIHRFPEVHPLSTYVFWLFNSPEFAGGGRRGSRNYSLLLAIDPGRIEAAIMPGYGLEDLLAEEHLHHLLAQADVPWRQFRWMEGIMQVIDGLDSLLETASILGRGERENPALDESGPFPY